MLPVSNVERAREENEAYDRRGNSQEPNSKQIEVISTTATTDYGHGSESKFRNWLVGQNYVFFNSHKRVNFTALTVQGLGSRSSSALIVGGSKYRQQKYVYVTANLGVRSKLSFFASSLHA